LNQNRFFTQSLNSWASLRFSCDEHGVVVSGERNISRIIESDMQLSRDLAGRAGRDWSRIGALGKTAEDSCERWAISNQIRSSES